MIRILALAFGLTGAAAPSLGDDLPRADVYLLGEVHDDAVHHVKQAEIVERLSPTAILFEMLPATLSLDLAEVDSHDLDALDTALGWTGRGWPELALYQPIFVAAAEARIVGMAPDQADVRRAIEVGAAAVFGEGAEMFGLDAPLDPGEQDMRETLQAEAHCNTLPHEILPGFVEAQRFRDAAFARATLAAHETHGGTVVVITGNGHVTPWGMPHALRQAAPQLRVAAIAQLYDDNNSAQYDLVLRSEAPAQGDDPCAAFDSK